MSQDFWDVLDLAIDIGFVIGCLMIIVGVIGMLVS